MADKNINSLLKWLTTEIVIHKPEDPLTFIHNLSRHTVSQDTDYVYSVEKIESLMESTRTKSNDQVAEESSVLNQAITVTENNATPNDMNRDSSEILEYGAMHKDFSKMIESMRQIATELDPEKAARSIAVQTCKLLQCEKAVLFTFDGDTKTVTADSEQALREKSFPIKQGVIARCLQSGKVEVIPDVAVDTDFDDEIDNVLGVEKVTNLLLCPLTDFETGEVCGVIQVINKKEFGSHDVDCLQALGTIGQITLQNGIIYGMAAAEKIRNESMIQLWRHLNDESKVYNIHSLLFTITRRCVEIVDAEKCTFYFVDHQNKELWSIQGEVNIRMPIDKGMAGQCASTGEIVNEADVYKHEQFSKATDVKTGFVTKSMLCVPMKATGNRVIGVIQLINKKGIIEVFDQNDEQILELVLSAAAPIVERNQLFFVKKVKDTVPPAKDDKFVSDLSSVQVQRRKSKTQNQLGQLQDIGDVIEEDNMEENIEEENTEEK